MKGAARRAEALRELARLLESGVDAARALATLARAGESGSTGARLASGAGLVEGLRAAGLLTAREGAFVGAVEPTGRVDAALAQVAADVERRARIERRVRSGLVTPLALLVVAAFAAPAPALARGALDTGGYLLAVAAVVLPVLAALWLVGRHGDAVVDGLRRVYLRLGGSPTLGQRQRLFAGLGRMLASGLDVAGALRALAGVEPGAMGARLRSAAADAAGGRALADALRRHRLLACDADAAIVQAGESAGRLAGSLCHHADRLGERLEHRAALAGEWLPRAIYVLVVTWVAARFLR